MAIDLTDPQDVVDNNIDLATGRAAEHLYRNCVLRLLLDVVANGGGGGGGAAGLGDETETVPAITHTVSVLALAANASRKAGSFIQNNTDVDMWLTNTATAVVGTGKRIAPGGAYVIQSLDAFRAILATAKTTGQVNVTEVA
jgi:hypothetical protein